MLSDRDQAILAFEEEWIDHPVGRELAIKDTFGYGEARYRMQLARIIQLEDAIAAHPQLVYRLRARMERRLNHRDRALLRRDE